LDLKNKKKNWFSVNWTAPSFLAQLAKLARPASFSPASRTHV
jgi:hypothetical protein